MKWIFILLYVIITWTILGVVNLFRFLWHIDFNHFRSYSFYFCKVKELKNYFRFSYGLNWYEKIIYNSLK